MRPGDLGVDGTLRQLLFFGSAAREIDPVLGCHERAPREEGASVTEMS